MEAYSTVRIGTYPERLAAAAGLALALVLLHRPLRRKVRFRYTVRGARLARRIGHRDLDPARAEALVDAVRHTARLWPGRAACMETSLGAVLAAALLGHRLNWCLGVRFQPPPVEYHAWAEMPWGGPVGEYTAGGWHQHTALTIWDVLDAAAGSPWGFSQWDTDDPEGEDVRIGSVGQLSVIYFANRALRHLSVLDIVWLG
ncbi:lasso peptide biosynthesis B2 protein [Streptomyces lunalinharesii]